MSSAMNHLMKAYLAACVLSNPIVLWSAVATAPLAAGISVMRLLDDKS